MKKRVRSIFPDPGRAKIGPAKNDLTLFLALAAMTLTACAGAPEIVPQVVVGPPQAPRAAFFIEKVQAQSRETASDARERNEAYARALSEQLKEALRAAGKSLEPPPADSIRPKLYLAYEPVTSSARGGRRAEAYVEVRLELVDAAGTVLYVTHTRAVVRRMPLQSGWTPEADQLAREALATAVRDFVSRL